MMWTGRLLRRCSIAATQSRFLSDVMWMGRSVSSSSIAATQSRFFSGRRSRTPEELRRLNEEERVRSKGPNAQDFYGRTSLYHCQQKMLLVGDGNFSFAHSVAARLGVAPLMYATSFNSLGELKKMFPDVQHHIRESVKRGVKFLFNVDAAKLLKNSHVNGTLYDCIVFNRPHVGVHKQDTEDWVIRKNQKLIDDFLHNAKRLLTENGEIHISVKTNPPYNRWDVEEIARRHGLVTLKKVRFPLWEYPYYENKKASKDDPNATFCNKCTVTYVFGKA